MRKSVLIIGAIILLIFIVLLSGGIYEKYFVIPLKIIYNEECIFEEECPINFWRYGMKMRKGSFLKLYNAVLKDGRTPVEALNFLSEGLGDKMLILAKSYEKEPQNAELDVKDIKPYFVYLDDIDGKAVNIDKFFQHIAKAMDGGSANLTTESIKADITREMLEKRTEKVASYKTSFTTSVETRKSNIRMALKTINGTVVMPDDEFSFNRVVGPRTVERGYKEAKIIFNGKFVPGVGGGVCQVSTTVYNAALLAGLEIVSATHHSLPVSYVPPSRDAMVTSWTNFVFKNNTDYPIYIFTDSSGDKAMVSIYGIKNSDEISLESVLKKRIAYKNKSDNGIYLANNQLKDYKLLRSGKEGLISELYMIKAGQRTKIREDTYAPQDAIWQKIEHDKTNVLMTDNQKTPYSYSILQKPI